MVGMPADRRSMFDLDPSCAYLNHGGFGVVPRVVSEVQNRWRLAEDTNPLRFNRLELHEAIAKARGAGAEFLGVPPDEMALVRNASEGVSTVLSSLGLGTGDEIVVSNHGYGSVRMAVEHWCTRSGARLVEARLRMDDGPAAVAAVFAEAVGARTRLVVVDDITSSTAWQLPVREVVTALRDRGLGFAVLVDAAHAPGQCDQDIAGSGADFWVGNFHKWAFTPRGTAGMWLAPSWRTRVHPLVVSWGSGDPYPVNFDHLGTLDYSSWLSLPAGLDYWSGVGGWEQVRRSQELVAAGQRHVADRLGTSLDGLPSTPAPAMRLVRLPAGMLDGDASVDTLQGRLSAEFGVEVPPIWFEDEGYVRIAGQVYNTASDYERLADALLAIRPR